MDLQQIPSGELIDMLLKHTQYYMSFAQLKDKDAEQAEAKKRIELIIAEIKSRKDFQGQSLDQILTM